ncbi:MAG: N-acetyl-gamma-glutamyl-phosphate reductase [Ktedonobacteraceae bacterium]
MNRISVAIVGGSGYTAGELLRVLLFHPQVEITQVTSSSHAGHYVHSVHPNLRKLCSLRFCHTDDLSSCDMLFLCLPHGASSENIERYQHLAPRIIDLSADFRLRSPDLYRRWYGNEHREPSLLTSAVYGLPELHREELSEATLVSGTGCMATAAILGLAPLYRAGLVNLSLPVVVEAKVGSSAAGAAPGASSHHPDRSGAVRSFEPTGHRHTAELIQELGALSNVGFSQTVAFSATAVELVRGVLITAHVFVNEDIDERLLWRLYREAYAREPFIRLVKERSGVYRYPEPKILAGSNFCDIGFELDAPQRRVVVIAALDNLMKGATGNAVQSLNAMYGWDETLGLSFPGLHPI